MSREALPSLRTGASFEAANRECHRGVGARADRDRASAARPASDKVVINIKHMFGEISCRTVSVDRRIPWKVWLAVELRWGHRLGSEGRHRGSRAAKSSRVDPSPQYELDQRSRSMSASRSAERTDTQAVDPLPVPLCAF